METYENVWAFVVNYATLSLVFHMVWGLWWYYLGAGLRMIQKYVAGSE